MLPCGCKERGLQDMQESSDKCRETAPLIKEFYLLVDKK